MATPAATTPAIPIYLDYNATTPLDPRVCKAMSELLAESERDVLSPAKGWGNPSSGHVYGAAAKERLEKARAQVAGLIGASTEQVIFTSGGTETINHVIKGLAFAEMNRVSAGSSAERNEIITSAIEHVAVTQTIDYLVDTFGFKKIVVPVNSLGAVDPKDVVDRLSPRTLLITIMLANNEVGTVQPIQEITKQVRGHALGKGVYVHTDASQAVGKIPANVEELGVDFLTMAGHKIYAPKGIGALFIRDPSLRLDKFMHGANHESSRRAGTENVLLAVGFGVACEILTQELEEEMKVLGGLKEELYEKIVAKLGQNTTSRDGVPIQVKRNGDRNNSLPNTLSIGFTGGVLSPTLLAKAGDWVSCSAGAACHTDEDDGQSTKVSHVLQAMNLPSDVAKSTIRLSVGRYTTPKDIEAASTALVNAVRKSAVGGASSNQCNVPSKATKRLYFEDSYRFTCTTAVVDVQEDAANEAKLREEDMKQHIVYGVYTEETIMHPQGGGQPTDLGFMRQCSGDGTGAVFHVLKVQTNGPMVCHFGWFEGASFKPGDMVQQTVDENARRLHARLHSAGHCLDAAVRLSGHKELVPTKGCHFPHSNFVEYKGSIPAADREGFKQDVERHVNSLVQQAIPTYVQEVSAVEAARLCGEEIGDVPEKSDDNAIRVVQVGSTTGCPCGGTHVKNTKEIGKVTVRKVKCKKGMIQISYQLES